MEMTAGSWAYDLVAEFAISGKLDNKVTAKEATKKIENALDCYAKSEVKKAIEDKKGSPFRCPICNGTGFVPIGFYSNTSGECAASETVTENCRSCDGTGIVWNIELR